MYYGSLVLDKYFHDILVASIYISAIVVLILTPNPDLFISLGFHGEFHRSPAPVDGRVTI